MPNERVPLDFSKLDPAMGEYISELRTALKESRMKLKEAADDRDRLKLLVAEAEASTQQRPDIRSMDKKTYRKFKAETLRALQRGAR